MALTIDLPTQIENQFRKEAARHGENLESFLVKLLEQSSFLKESGKIVEDFTESELLKKVDLDISETEWGNYRRLISLRNAECLTEKEHKNLIKLGDKIELANAKRLKYLLKLAQIRNVSIEKIMQDLNIKPVEV